MKSFKKIALVTTILSVFATTAQADEHTDLLDLLLQKGVITQKEHADRIEKYNETLENKQFNAANANNMSQFNAGQAQQNNQFNAGNQLMSDYYNMQGGLNNQSQMAGILASLGNMGQAIGNQTLAQGRANEGFGQSGMAAQEAAGNNVMGLDQANLTQMYNDFLEARDWSANNFQYANAGMPTQSAGGTTTQDVFSPGAGQQILGAGTALGGAAIGKGGR